MNLILNYDEFYDVEIDFKKVDCSFDHEFGTEKAFGAETESLKVYLKLDVPGMPDLIDVTDVIAKPLLFEITEWAEEKAYEEILND